MLRTLIEVELLANNVNPLVCNIMIMQKPIKAISGCWDVVGHDLPESFIVGYHKEIHHYHVAQMEFVYHVWDTHVAEGIQ